MKRHRGFTLIELLVVIAIIALLIAVVVVSITSARNKAKDSKIRSQLTSMRSQAQLYTGAGNYIDVTRWPTCASFSNGLNIFYQTGVNSFNDAGLFSGLDKTKMRCVSGSGLPSAGTSWAVAAQTSSGAWCVDSTGASRDRFLNGSKYTTVLTEVIRDSANYYKPTLCE